MDPIRTAVVDDEPDAREGILDLLRSDGEVMVTGEARTGREAVTLMVGSRPELVFLDVQMPELDGFAALDEVPEAVRPVVVFVTAYDEYALRAFDVHALDYLLKPFTDERFADALDHAKERVRQRRAGELGQQLAALLGDRTRTRSEHSSSASAQPAETPAAAATDTGTPDRLMVRTPKGTVFIRLEDIDWIEADDYYAKLHVAGRGYLIRETMQSLEARLDPRRFVRVHRSAIVNLDRVKTLQPYFRGAHVLTLHDGTQVTLSRSRRAQFERAVGCRL